MRDAFDHWLRCIWSPVALLAGIAIVVPLVFSATYFLLSSELAATTVIREALSASRIASLGAVLIRGLIVASACVVAATPIALWLADLRTSWVRPALLGALIIPFFVNDAIRAYAWAELLNQSGLLARAGAAITGSSELSFAYQPWSSLIPLMAAVFPFAVFVILYGALGRPKAARSAVTEINPSRLDRLLVVDLPLIAPYQVLAWIICFALVIASSVEEQYVGGPIPQSFATLMVALLRTGVPHALTFVSAFALIQLAIVIYLATQRTDRVSQIERGVLRFGRLTLSGLTYLWPLGHARAQRRNSVERQRRLRLTGILPPILLGLVIAASWLPVIVMFWRGISAESDGTVTLDHIGQALHNARIREALIRSFAVAVVCSLVALPISMATMAVAWRSTLPTSFLLVLLLAMTLPGEAVGLVIQQCARALGVRHGSVVLVVLAHVLWTIPFAGALAIAWGRGIPRNELIPLAEMGATRVAVWGSAIMRRAGGFVAGVLILGVLLSMNEYTRATYLGGASESLSSVIYGRLSAGSISGERVVFAVSSLVVTTTVTLFCVGAGVMVVGRRFRGRGAVSTGLG